MSIKAHFNDFTSRWSTNFLALIGFINIFMDTIFIAIVSANNINTPLEAFLTFMSKIILIPSYSLITSFKGLVFLLIASIFPAILLLKSTKTRWKYFLCWTWIISTFSFILITMFKILHYYDGIMAIAYYSFKLNLQIFGLLGLIPYFIILYKENKTNSRFNAKFVSNPIYKIFAFLAFLLTAITFLIFSAFSIILISTYFDK